MADHSTRFVLALLVAACVSPVTLWSAAGRPADARVPAAVQGPGTDDRMRSARETLARVLDQPEFQRSAAALWTEQLRRRVTRWMADILSRLGLGQSSGRAVARAMAWVVGLGALVALAWWLVQSLVRSSERRTLALAPGVSRRSSRSWARAALAAHRGGDEREASRCAFHAAVAQLEEQGTWRADDSRTPREYLRLLPATHRYRAVLADISGRFEQVWYGSARPSSDDSRALLTRLKELGCLASDRAI